MTDTRGTWPRPWWTRTARFARRWQWTITLAVAAVPLALLAAHTFVASHDCQKRGGVYVYGQCAVRLP